MTFSLHNPGNEIPSPQPERDCTHIWLAVGYRYLVLGGDERQVPMVRLDRTEPLLTTGERR